jgi:hypothetical protein
LRASSQPVAVPDQRCVAARCAASGTHRRAAQNIPQPRTGFPKRKAAGWGPGGSRTSAIVSGGWECDRRR